MKLFANSMSGMEWMFFPEKESTRFVYYPGDLLLGALFPIHAEYNATSGECYSLYEADGVIPLQATLYFLDEINRAEILPFTLGLAAYDTVSSLQKSTSLK